MLGLGFQHSHCLETFLGRQILRRVSEPSTRGRLRHNTDVLRRSKKSTGYKQSMDQALRRRGLHYNHNLFHDYVMGFPPVFENGCGRFENMLINVVERLNFEKCVSTPKLRIFGTTTHKKDNMNQLFRTTKRQRGGLVPKQLSEHHSELLDSDSLQGLEPLQQCALRQNGQRLLEPLNLSRTRLLLARHGLGNAHVNQLGDTAPRQTTLRSRNPCRWSTRWLLPSIQNSPAPCT